MPMRLVNFFLALAMGIGLMGLGHFNARSKTAPVSTGVTSMGLPAWLKGILCFDMLAGRLEIVALLLVLYPGTWFGRRAQSS